MKKGVIGKEGKINLKVIILSSILICILLSTFVLALYRSAIFVNPNVREKAMREDVPHTLINITINSTASQDKWHANSSIVQVNITLPAGFIYHNNTRGTSALGATDFTNNSASAQTLTWSNYTNLTVDATVDRFLVNGTGHKNISFWFNVTAPTPGAYNITITTLNANGSNVITSNVSMIVNAHTRILTSAGATAFTGINEDTNSYFNFTVNVSGSFNTTTVNVTLPNATWWKYHNNTRGTSNGTTFSNAIFTNTSTVLSWVNATGLLSDITENRSFWFNASVMKPGNYNLIVTTYNGTAGPSYTNTLTIAVADTTTPNVSIVFPTEGAIYRTFVNSSGFKYMNFNLTVQDQTYDVCWYSLTNGSVNYTMTNTTNSAYNHKNISITNGNYNARFWCNDSANNVNGTRDVSFTVNRALFVDDTTGDGGTIGTTTPTWTSTHTIDEAAFEEGFTKSLGSKERIKLKINNIEHHMGVKSLTASTVTLEIASDPVEAILSIGDTRKFDLTDDGYYDMIVTLDKIEASKADITIKSIYELVTEETEEVEEASEEAAAEQRQEEIAEGELTNLTILWIIIIIIIVLVLGWFGYKKIKE